MSTDKKTFVESSPMAQGTQREGRLKKVINHLPSRSKDNFILMLLLLMGIGGFSYLMSKPIGSKSTNKSLFSHIFYPQSNKAFTADFIKSDIVKTVGEMKTNSFIFFNFNGLSKDSKYEFTVGQTKLPIAEKNEIPFVFKQPGSYKIELKKYIEGRSIVEHSEFLNIK